MDITLVNEASLAFRNDNPATFCSLQKAADRVSLKLNNVSGKHTQEKLQDILNSLLKIDDTVSIPYSPDTGIWCSMRIVKENDGTEAQMDVMWTNKGNNCFFRILSTVLKDKAGLQMKMENLSANKTAKTSEIYALTNMVLSETLSCMVFPLGKVPGEMANSWTNGSLHVSGKFSLTLVLKEDFISTFFLGNLRGNPCCSVLAKMLDNQNAADTTIITADKREVKCHRAVLIESSPVFEAMFERSGMKESTTNQIVMDDLNETEVRALLGYLYKWEVKPALADITTAWKLLTKGNYYQLDELVNIMREIMMIRRVEFYSVDLAVEMLVFAYNIGGEKVSVKKRKLDDLLSNVGSDLSKKAVQVLKWYSSKNQQQIGSSEQYRKLYMDTPQIAMNLRSKFLLYMDTDAIEQDRENRGIYFKV